MRCQYCGKNLWPLRGLFDEDFCSRDHRQRYHERVRKALEHLPKGQAAPRPTGIAGFQFEKPSLQQPAATLRSAAGPSDNPSTPVVPDFAHASAAPSFATSSFSFKSVTPAGGNAPSLVEAAAASIAPNVMSIETLRERVHQNHAAVAFLDAPMGIAPQAGNMALRASQRSTASPEVFDELNHVYLHEPDPLLEASLPLVGGLTAQIAPIATTARARHTAAAGPSGAGRVEFFPMQPRFSQGMLADAKAGEAFPEAATPAGKNIWLEDLVSWQIPVSMAPNRSSLAMLPFVEREAALDRFRSAQPASASNPTPLEWQFAASAAERKPFGVAVPVVATMVLEFPAPRNAAAAPLSDEVAIFDASTFNLLIPEISVDAGDLEMLTDELADVAPEQTKTFETPVETSETAPHGAEWLPMEAKSVLPTSTPELGGALAEPRIGADLVARSIPSQLRNGARSVNAGLSISIPDRMVRLKNGPEFFAAEPVIADSVARPVTARPYAALVLHVPEFQASDSDPLFRPAVTETMLPSAAFDRVHTPRAGANAIAATSIEVPDVELQAAGFGTDELKKINVWQRDAGDRSPRQFGWMDPKLALNIPDSHYEDYPLALQVSVPEPRTVTVFETATYDQQTKVLSINDARSKRFAVPGYLKGMAAGVMLASFLWFGSSSIKSDGITLRPGDLIRLTIQRRAVYEVGDNFHAGLASWDGKNFAKTWSYDKEGFIRPGRLAMYKPSHEMQDYKLEFLTQIERKGVNWVVRAADDHNYYGMKLAVTEPGPRPLVALVRYVVIDGKKESHGELPLQVMMHNNRPYRVEVDVKGNKFLTSIEGQVVDSWSDDRLKTGGVGFFTEGSEKARLYWMKITKNSDFLGKLCSILVPKES